MQDAMAEQDGRKVVKEEFKLILPDGLHRCSAVRQRKKENEREWNELFLRIFKLLSCNS